MKKLNRFVVILTGLLPLFSGCAYMAAEHAKQEMQLTFDGVIGCTEEEVILYLGAPSSIQTIGDLKVYRYYKSLGIRSNAYANALCNGVYGTGNVYESYDQTDLFFKDGRAISWKENVQR